MHNLEPFYNWRDNYTAETDERSPFYRREYNEFAYDQKIYNFFIHPQWDNIESDTLYTKLLYVDYEQSYAIIELIGEWNDAINNDIYLLRKNLINFLLQEGISKYIIIGENVLNFHGDTDDYYEDWFERVLDMDGWIVGLNFKDFVLEEMQQFNVHRYINCNGPFAQVKWRPFKPDAIHELIQSFLQSWIESGRRQIS